MFWVFVSHISLNIFQCKKQIQLEDLKFTSDCVSYKKPQHQAIRLDIMVNFLASLCDGEVWRVLGVLQCLTEQ